MIERVEKLPKPEPDMNRLVTALRRGKPDRVPLIELAIDLEVVQALRGGPAPMWNDSFDAVQSGTFARDHIAFWRRLGYDYIRVYPRVPFDLTRVCSNDSADLSRGKRSWADSAHGTMETLEQAQRYPWPTLTPADLRCAETVLAHLPEGMGAIGWSGGIFEFASQLIGLERFFTAIYDEPDLVRLVIDRVAGLIHETFQAFCRMDAIRAIWMGDDLGSKNATMVDPGFLREAIFPWYRKYAELAHGTGRLFLLHSCGNLTLIMDDLIELGVDGKHSFEDAIMPVEQIKARWGDRMAILGGVDVDLLSRGSESDVRARTEAILRTCAPDGGFACGSGNSIPNYAKPANFLAMLETVHRFNGHC